MALIKCPECGSEASDRAAACPRCGFPIQQIKTANLIRVKMPGSLPGGMFGFWRVTRKDTSELIGKAAQKSIIEFESDKTVDLEIRAPGAFKGFEFSVSPGKKYACSFGETFFGPKLACYEVDNFDAD